jgi:hypothetical protein
MEPSYGYFLDIESQITQTPILVKRTKHGFDVVQRIEVPKQSPFIPKSIYYKNQYKTDPNNISKMASQPNSKYTPDESDNESEYDYEEPETRTWYYVTLAALFIILVIYA